MRIKPKIEDEKSHVYLTRWDLFSSFDPRMVCNTCKYYDSDKMLCVTDENKGIRLSLYDTDVYACCEHSIYKKMFSFLMDNPYEKLSFSDREKIRKKLAKEIDISIYLKNFEKIHLNDIEIDKSTISDKNYSFFGYNCSNVERFSERVDNLLTKRIKNLTKINKIRIKNIFVYINGNGRVFNECIEFEQYLKTINQEL